MEILFNKNNNGTAELKDLIPYIDKDMDFDFFAPDIRTTTHDIINIIGPEVYTAAETVYIDDEDPTTLEGKFLRAVRYPIAVNAYRLFAPTNDLSHTNNGRKMRSDDSEKTPFEWMLDRDDAAQEKRYYRALDDLIVFLDNLRIYEDPSTAEQTFETELATAWRNSESYKLTHDLFIRTVSEFDKYFPIRSRLLLNNLSPGMADCENEEILSRIGREKFDELKSKLKAGTPLTDSADFKLLKHIKQAVVSSAMAWAMPRFAVNLFPEGVLQHYTSDRATTKGKKPALNIEPETARMAFERDAASALRKIEDLITPPTESNSECPEPIPPIVAGEKFMSI